MSIKAFTTLESALVEEWQILERLYYKGKNQHRSALFWRHVGEVRRILKRMVGSGKFRASNTLECVRGSFLDSGNAEMSKKAQRRQAWTRVPPSKLVVSALHQLREISKLLIKAESVFESAYRSFELLVQSATFLPLALALVAIASRARMLTSDLSDCLEEIWPTMRTIATVLECDRYGPKSLHLRPGSIKVQHQRTEHASFKTSASMPMVHVNTSADSTEDVGKSVARPNLQASGGVTLRSSLAAPAFASPIALSLARLSPITVDRPLEPGSSQQDAVSTMRDDVSSPASHVAEQALGRALLADANLSDLPSEDSIAGKRLSAADIMQSSPRATSEDNERSLEHAATPRKLKKTAVPPRLGGDFPSKPAKHLPGSNHVPPTLPSPPPPTKAKMTQPGKKRTAEYTPLEAQGSNVRKKAKMKTKRKQGDEIDAIFSGL